MFMYFQILCAVLTLSTNFIGFIEFYEAFMFGRCASLSIDFEVDNCQKCSTVEKYKIMKENAFIWGHIKKYETIKKDNTVVFGNFYKVS